MNAKFSRNSEPCMKWKQWMDDPSHLNPNAISKCATDLLTSIGTRTSEEIEQICKLVQNGKECKIEFSELLDSWTNIFDGMTLVATKDPVAFAKTNFAKYLQKVEAGFKLDRECAEYDTKIEKYKELMMLKEKAEESSKKKVKVVGADGKTTTTVQTGGTDRFKDITFPTFKFPEKFQVGSESNCRNVAKNVKCCHKSHLSDFPSATDMSFDGKYRLADIHFDHDLKMLLLCGIGVCSKSIKNDHYKNFVLEYASQGKLAYVIADESICFGTNYPFTRVFIMSDFAECHSIETIMQVIARGGRLGHSYEASAYLPENLFRRLQAYAETGKDIAFNEGKNIAFQVMQEFAGKIYHQYHDMIEEFDSMVKRHNDTVSYAYEITEAQLARGIQPETIEPVIVEPVIVDKWEDLLDELSTKVEEKIEQTNEKSEEETEQEETLPASENLREMMGSKLSVTPTEIQQSEQKAPPPASENLREIMGSKLSVTVTPTGKYIAPSRETPNDLRSIMGSALPTTQSTTGKYVVPSKRRQI